MTASTALLGALLLADARLPVGGHTVSGGLEPALLAGLQVSDIPAFLRSRLATVTRVEAATAVVAAAAVRSGSGVTAADVAWAWAARTPLAALRTSSVAQGRAVLRVVRSTRPGGPADRWLRDLENPLLGRAVVLGAFAGELDVEAAALARLVGYDDLQTVAAAALKLLPLDPVTPVGWVLDRAHDLDALVSACAPITDPDDIPAPSAPNLEAWHFAHADATRRLFRA